MKVLGINGSPRKSGNSASMLEAALSGASEKGAETELIHLSDLNFSGCKSCFACKRLGGASFAKCALSDDLKAVLEKILAADAVIFAMPIYFGDVPGMVRNVFERLWFPGLLYKADGSTAYEKNKKIGLIYTMNVPDESMYKYLIANHKAIFEMFFGEAHTLCATDTMQFDDYSKYASEMFDAEAKKQSHETKFPKDILASCEFGNSLVM